MKNEFNSVTTHIYASKDIYNQIISKKEDPDFRF